MANDIGLTRRRRLNYARCRERSRSEWKWRWSILRRLCFGARGTAAGTVKTSDAGIVEAVLSGQCRGVDAIARTE